MSDNFGKLLFRESFGGKVVICPHVVFEKIKKKKNLELSCYSQFRIDDESGKT